MSSLVALQIASTLPLVGLIWFVQVVHYPMLSSRSLGPFRAVHSEHAFRTSWLVVPLMVTELVTSVLLVVYAGERWLPLARAGLVMVGVAWLSTFLIQVPLHQVLSRGWNAEAHRRLVRTNWIRTAAWTARGLLVVVLAIGGAGSMTGMESGVAPAAHEEQPHHGAPPHAPAEIGSSPALYRT